MPISLKCPGCGQEYKVPDETAGRSTKCRKCAVIIQIPTAQQAAEAELPTVDYQTTPAQQAGLNLAGAEAGTGWKDNARRLGEQATQNARRLGEQATPLLRKVPPKILIPVAGAVLLLFCLLPTFLVARWLFGGSSPLGPGEKYLPDQPRYITSVQVRQVRESPLYQRLKGELPELKRAVEGEGLTDRMERMLAAGDLQEGSLPILVGQTRNPATAEDIKSSFTDPPTFVEEKVDGDITLYRYPGLMERFQPGALKNLAAFCIPEKYVVLQGNVDTVKSILKRGKPPQLSAELQAALKQTDMSVSLAAVLSLKGAPIPPGPGTDQLRKLADKLEYATLEVKIATDLSVAGKVHCTEESAAKELADMARGMLALAKTFARLPSETSALVDAIKIEAKGNDVLVDLQVDQDKLVKGLKYLTTR